MPDNIAILRNGLPIGLKVFDFPGGETGVKLELDAANSLPPASRQTVWARIQGARDFMTLALVTDALRRIDDTPIHLVLPYVPYGRQDRVCVKGESFSLKVFAGLINGLGFKSVTTFDPHSDVTGALIERLTIVDQVAIVHAWDDLCNRLRAPGVVLVSPDAGANKKVSALAGYLGHTEFIRADKLRDLLDRGRIKETIVYGGDLTGLTIAIIDDLVDGGASFLPLAAALKAKGAAKVLLYTTHAIYSRGVEPLLNGGIDELWATNAYKTNLDPRVRTLDLGNLDMRWNK
jgi:ribose-phosphate pyrophosphokinase